MLSNRVTQRSARAFTFTQTVRCCNKGTIIAKQKETGMPATVPVSEIVQSVPELEEEQPTKITGLGLNLKKNVSFRLTKKAFIRNYTGMA